MTDSKTISQSLEERDFCIVRKFFNHQEIDFTRDRIRISPDYTTLKKTKHTAKRYDDKQVACQTSNCVPK